MIRAHHAAVKALLTAVPNLTVYVDDELARDAGGRLVAPETPYTVVYNDTGLGVTPRLTGRPTAKMWLVSTLYVGETQAQVGWMAEKAQAALDHARPVVAGRVCGRLEQVQPGSIRLDTDVSPPLYVATDKWRFTSNADA